LWWLRDPPVCVLVLVLACWVVGVCAVHDDAVRSVESLSRRFLRSSRSERNQRGGIFCVVTCLVELGFVCGKGRVIGASWWWDRNGELDAWRWETWESGLI
jgi:hypothetical protein